MGYACSSSFPEICKVQEDMFKRMLQKYCGQEEGKVNSNMQANNYGLVNIATYSELFEEKSLLSVGCN